LTELPTDDNDDLFTPYSAQDYIYVANKDNIRVAIAGTIEEYVLHQFKDYVGVANVCTLEWEGQSTVAPFIAPVYLQIYNRNTLEWDTVDTDSSSDVDVDFILTSLINGLTDYKDESSVISCRVYQYVAPEHRE